MAISEVFIYGNKYRIVSDEDEEFLKKVASYVDNKMTDIEKGVNVLTTSKIAVMAAFDIAAEYLAAKNELEKSEAIINEIVSNLDKNIS